MSSSITALCNVQRLETNAGDDVLNKERVSNPNLLFEVEKRRSMQTWRLEGADAAAGVWADAMASCHSGFLVR